MTSRSTSTIISTAYPSVRNIRGKSNFRGHRLLRRTFDPNDIARTQAVELIHRFRADDNVVLLSTRDVLNEILAHFSRSRPRTRQLIGRFVLGMLSDPKYWIVSVTREQYLTALRLYIARPDKRYSMVDCISMTVMRDEETHEVLATDRDFTQEGFVNVLK